MTRIEFELHDGTKKTVEFEGTPTQADIEEVANKLEFDNNNNNFKMSTNNLNDTTAFDNGENVLQGGIEKRIDLRPSNVLHNISDTLGAGLVAPVKMLKDKQTYTEAFNDVKNNIQEERKNNLLANAQDGLLDFMTYGKVNPFKIQNTVANVGLNGAVQGGLIETIDSLKDKGLNIKENVKDMLTGSAVGGALGSVGAFGLEKLAKGLESPVFTDKLAKTLEFLTSVPQKYTKRAYAKELAGDSILNGKFDVDKAYKPVGQKLAQAKSYLPTKQNFATEFNKLGQKAYKGFGEKQTQLEQDIREILNKMDKENRTMDVKALQNKVKETIDLFANGGDINNAYETAGREIKDVKRLLGILNDEERANALNGVLTKAQEKLGFLPTFDKDAENIAFSLLSQQTGKNPAYLRMTLKANTPQKARQKAFETLMSEIEEKPFDVLDIDGLRAFEKFPELYKIAEDSTSNKEFMSKLANRVIGRDFNKYKYGTDELAQTIEEADGRLNQILQDLIENVKNKRADINPYEQALKQFDENFNGLDEYSQELFNGYQDDLINVINKIDDIENPRLKSIDLHNIKELLYDKANYDVTNSGIKNNVLKALANDINTALRRANDDYANVNEKYKMLKDVEKAFGGSAGVNPNTIASKLMAYGDKANILSNMDDRLRSLDSMLDPQFKFFLDTKKLKQSMNEIDDMLSQVGNPQYVRNPRLLEGFNDIPRETALADLQARTGINFMEDLENARTREILEKLTPGQGGGSGSAQGYANLFRNALTTSLAGSIGGVGGSLTGALLGLLASSPRLMAKNSIKNLTALYNTADEIPQWLVPLLFTPGAED